MASEVAQLNTRIDRDLKEEGDRVLARFGVSPSVAIRKLWNYLSVTHELPEFLGNDASETDSAAETRRHAILDGAGLATRLALSSATGEPADAGKTSTPFEQVVDQMYDEMAASVRGVRV